MDGFMVPAMIGDKWCAVAADEETAKFLSRHPGEILTTVFKVKGGRDLVLHNQFFAILTRAVHSLRRADGSPMYLITSSRQEKAAVDHLRILLCYAVGFTETITDFEGKARTVPRSIGFEECAEEDAERFRSASYPVLAGMLGCFVGELLSGTFG